MSGSKEASAVSTVPPARSLVIGTAGHIDHGKTALVLALTGTDTDRLPEEKSRGITIDLGFAPLYLEGRDGARVEFSLIDVPGHQALIHNMLAGAGGIEAVMLVIAADEGVKAQTVEHLAICRLLGVQHGLVVLTKRDAIGAERLMEVKAEVRALVENTFLASAPVLPVSAFTGEGIAELKQALLQLALMLPERSRDFVLRLPLDRAFSIPGFGTVVTGTLRDGQVNVGDSVQLQPAGRTVRVRGVQVHNRQVKEAHAPTRTALNLASVEVSEVGRGDTVVAPGTLAPVSAVDVEFTVVPGTRVVRHRSRLSMHAFTSDAMATVLLYQPGADTSVGKHLARLKLSKPMLLTPDDHFVLRHHSPPEVVGGGRVLDPEPLPQRRKAAARMWLDEIQSLTPAQQIPARVRRRGMRGLSLAALVRETGLNEAALRRITTELMTAKQVIGAKVEHPYFDRFIQPEAMQSAADLLFKELSRKDTRSASVAELLSRSGLEPWVCDLAVKRLLEAKPVSLSGSELSIKASDPVAEAQTKLLARVEEQYRSAGLASPLVNDAATALNMPLDELRRQATLLLRSGKLVRMGADTLLMHADALARLRADLAKDRGRSFDVGWFKTFTGLTRKHAIPILEYLDRTRVTANQQGIRTIL